MASMRNWPKAARACLLARISCRLTMLVESSVRFRCAVSMTASRSLSLAIDSWVLREVSLRSVPTLCVMRSSRSLTARAMSPWRATLISAKLWSRPFSSASSAACAFASRRRRLICTKSATARRRSARTARPPSASSASAGSTVTLPILMGSKTIRPKIDRFGALVRPKQEHMAPGRSRAREALAVDRVGVAPYFSPSMAIRPILIFPTPFCASSRSPSSAWTPSLAGSSTTCSRPCTTRPASGSPRRQLGVSRRLIVMDPAKDDAPKTPLVMINPEILDRSEELRMHDEGCLSIPDFTAEIERPAKIRVAYIDREGKPEERELAGIWSTLVQHEIDHLNGILFIDYLSRLKRDMVVRNSASRNVARRFRHDDSSSLPSRSKSPSPSSRHRGDEGPPLSLRPCLHLRRVRALPDSGHCSAGTSRPACCRYCSCWRARARFMPFGASIAKSDLGRRPRAMARAP